MGDRTRLEIANGVAWLTLDDGKVNALSTEMLAEIAAALDAAEAAGAVVVLRGREGMFSAGFDLKTFKKGPAETVAMLRAGADAIVATPAELVDVLAPLHAGRRSRLPVGRA